MTRSLEALLLLGLIALFARPGRLEAGACCVGSTGAVPVRLGECEKWLVGAGVSGERDLGRWDAEGTATGSSLEEQALVASFGAGYRWSRWGQVVMTLPARLNQKQAGELEGTGGGVGDLRLATIVSPFEEGIKVGPLSLPRLYATVGTRLPTGVSWEDSESDLMADVTGLPGVSVTGGLSLERATLRFPWSLGVDAEVPVGESEVPPLVVGSASLGRYFGTNWTAVASLRYSYTPPSDDGRDSSARTTAGLRIVHGRRLAWRAWLGADMDIPVSGFGRSNPVIATAGAGLLIVR